MLRRLSLADKCLLLFGGAIVAILLAALTAPYFRMSALVDDGQLEISRQMVSMWEKLDDRFQTDPSLQGGFGPTPGDPTEYAMGEDLRRRTYVFTGPDGTELCLMPDLTIPTCQAYLVRAPMADRAMKLCYAGSVFRHDPKAPDRPGQGYQAGVENITAANAAAADAER